jgi:hypothetical protein
MICGKILGSRDHDVEWKKPISKGEISHVFGKMQSLDL